MENETYRKTLESYYEDYNLTYEEISEYLTNDNLFELLDYVEMRLTPDHFDDFLDVIRQYQ